MIVYALKKLSRGFIVSCMIVIQFALSIVLFNQSFFLNKSYSTSVSQMEKVLGDTAICKMRDQSDEDMLLNVTANQQDVTQRQQALYEYLKHSTLFDYICYQDYAINFYNDAQIDTRFIDTYDFDGIISLKGFRMDEDFIKMYPFEVQSGRMFAPQDFVRSSQIPVILGYNYKMHYALGDEIRVPSNPLQTADSLKVIGFANQNTYIANLSAPQGLLLADDYILYPFMSPDEEFTFYDYDMQFFQSAIVPIDYEATRASIRDKSRALGLYEIETTKPASKVQNIANMIVTNRRIVLLNIITVIVFAGLTVLSGLIYRYRLHTRDFSKFRLFGVKECSLAGVFTFEIAICLLISNVLAVVISSFSVPLDWTFVLLFDFVILSISYLIVLHVMKKSKLSV